MFRFPDPECEQRRRLYLARSLVSLAASRIKHARYDDAARLARQIRSLGTNRLSRRERTITRVARHRALARASSVIWPVLSHG
jgi:hypothetical protein